MILVIASLAMLLIAGVIGSVMQSRNESAAFNSYLDEACLEEWAQETEACSSR